MTGIAMPGGNPATLEALAFQLEYAAQGTADLGASTRQVTTSVAADAQWTGSAADGYSSFTANLGQGASAAEDPLLQIASAVRDYAGALRTAQSQVQAYSTIAQAAQNDASGSLLSSAEMSGQNAIDALNALQQAGDSAASQVTSAAGDLNDLFGQQGPVQGWISKQPVVEQYSLFGWDTPENPGDIAPLTGLAGLGGTQTDPIPLDTPVFSGPIPRDVGGTDIPMPGLGGIGVTLLPGSPLINFESTGEDEPGEDTPGGETAPGNDEPGDDEPGNDEPGNDEPGDDKPGEPQDQPQSVPQAAQDVVNEIDKGEWPPQGIRGGGTFQNDGRGGGEELPKTDSEGNPITYQEWDVNPPGPGGRDAIRVVTGSDGSAYYTDDHYNTFTRIR